MHLFLPTVLKTANIIYKINTQMSDSDDGMMGIKAHGRKEEKYFFKQKKMFNFQGKKHNIVQ